MEILSRQRPQIVSGDFSTNFHPFWPCDGSLESSNPTLLNHMGTSHFNTSYSIRSCSFLSKIFLLILTGSIASKGIATFLKIPKLQDYLVLAVVVRELSKHQSASLFDCCVFIARFASLSCYSSAETRIQPKKSYHQQCTLVFDTPIDTANFLWVCLFHSRTILTPS